LHDVEKVSRNKYKHFAAEINKKKLTNEIFMSIEDLKSVKTNLPYGWTIQAAKALGCHPATLSRMMNGTLPINSVFLEHLVSMAEKHNDLSKSLSERINKLKN
jgi:hypothetical protein